MEGKLCNFITDNGSCPNVASIELVEKLILPTRKHPRPYALQWLNKEKGLKVSKHALINFNVGIYMDELWCDVLPMDACHILLGRPWQFDRNVKHDGKSNIYTVQHGNTKSI